VGLRAQDHKSLCTAVMIYATLVVPKCFLSILTPTTQKSRSNPRQLLHPCQVHPLYKFGDHRPVACRDNADIGIFYNALKPSKVGQGDLVFVSDDWSLVCLSVQDFRSLSLAVMICATLVVPKCFLSIF